MVGWHHWLYGHGFEQAPATGGGQWSLACRGPWSHEELVTPEQLNSNPPADRHEHGQEQTERRH